METSRDWFDPVDGTGPSMGLCIVDLGLDTRNLSRWSLDSGTSTLAFGLSQASLTQDKNR